MEPHIKVYKLANLPTKEEKVKFVNKHKDDKLFVQMVLLSVSPEYRFTFDKPFTYSIKKVPTMKSAETFGEFRHLLMRYEDNTDRLQELLDLLDTFDIPTQCAYKIIMNRELGVSLKDIIFVPSSVTTIKNEYPVAFGFPDLPCIVQLVPANTLRVNILSVYGHNTVVSLDSLTVKLPNIIENELQTVPIQDNSNLTGYLTDDMLLITDFYTTVNKKAFERIRDADLLLTKSDLQSIKLVPSFEVATFNELTKVINKCTDNVLVLTKQNSKPSFSEKTNEQIYLDSKYIKEIKDLND
jgi:hypothetical protein